eukprot:161633-Rhodomonas_salina.1
MHQPCALSLLLHPGLDFHSALHVVITWRTQTSESWRRNVTKIDTMRPPPSKFPHFSSACPACSTSLGRHPLPAASGSPPTSSAAAQNGMCQDGPAGWSS